MTEEFRAIAQKYLGMKPSDHGCLGWSGMQQKMADELEEVVKNDNLRFQDFFRNFLRMHHLTSKWEEYLKENESISIDVLCKEPRSFEEIMDSIWGKASSQCGGK